MEKSMPAPTYKRASDEAVWSWSGLPYILGALLACLLLVLAIQYGNGYYNVFSFRLLILAVALWILLIPALFWAEATSLAGGRELSHLSTGLVILPAVLVILELRLGLQDQYIYYNQVPFYPTFVAGTVQITILLIATYVLEPFLVKRGGFWQAFVKYRFVFIILLSVILKFATVFASYINLIDVGIMMQESSATLLAGHNPYTTPTAGYGGFNYLPMHLLLPLPFYVLFGDARFGMIIWELVGLGLIYHLAKTELRSARLLRLAELALLLFVWQPRGLFIIEQAWGEPLAVGAVAATFYLWYRQPGGPAGDILLAVLLAVKQYFVYLGLPLFYLYNFSWKRYVTTGLALALMILPFVAWNPTAFYNRNVLHFFGLPIQTNSLGVTAYLWEQGWLIPRWLSPVAAAGVALGVGFLLRRFGLVGYLHTLVLTFFCLFIFGQQAFANYYYLLSFFQVMAIIFFMVYHLAGAEKPPIRPGRGVV
jgi:hypothetical protein